MELPIEQIQIRVQRERKGKGKKEVPRINPSGFIHLMRGTFRSKSYDRGFKHVICKSSKNPTHQVNIYGPGSDRDSLSFDHLLV